MLQRVDAAGCLVADGSLPCRQEVRLPLSGPREHQPGLTRRQAAFHDAPVSNGDLDFVPGVRGVEMSRGMVPDMHPDDDSEESAKLRHLRRR